MQGLNDVKDEMERSSTRNTNINQVDIIIKFGNLEDKTNNKFQVLSNELKSFYRKRLEDFFSLRS